MKGLREKWLYTCYAISTLVMLSSCGSSPVTYVPAPSSEYHEYGATAALGLNQQALVPETPAKTPSQLYKEANIQVDLIPKGRHGRQVPRYMRPSYITIHSTQNYSAGAWQHSKALRNGKLRGKKRPGGNRTGYLTWHYTVDDSVAVQHLPHNEQGEHADFDGPGNNYSFGIEMCEHYGNNREATLERTAKLTAWLMHEHNIPLNHVVPHHHWGRKGVDPEHKNCPHFLLDNGRPGAKWQWFISKIEQHYRSIAPSSLRYSRFPQYASSLPEASSLVRAARPSVTATEI